MTVGIVDAPNDQHETVKMSFDVLESSFFFHFSKSGVSYEP